MGDIESFKLLFLVYKCGLKNGQDIKEIISEKEGKKFKSLIGKDVNQVSKILASEVLLNHDI